MPLAIELVDAEGGLIQRLARNGDGSFERQAD
jgi:hypothetical protein